MQTTQTTQEALIRRAYENFNSRNIPEILETMTADVLWPKGFECGFVSGKAEVEKYWLRQWSEINPTVIPEKITESENGSFRVDVRQTVKDLDGNVILDGMVVHTYFFENDLIKKMEIGE
jgi:nuclear transport factor 2 (NTF2) superfamily protein